MFDYEIIYRKKQHYITIPQRHNRKLNFSNEHLHKTLQNQKNPWGSVCPALAIECSIHPIYEVTYGTYGKSDHSAGHTA